MDFATICRICCEKKQRMRPLLALDANHNLIQQFYRDFLRLEISIDDGLPQNVCGSCIEALTSLQKTIEEIRSNDSMLRKLLLAESNSEIKERIEIEALQNGIAREIEVETLIASTEDELQNHDLKKIEDLIVADDDSDWRQSEEDDCTSEMDNEKKSHVEQEMSPKPASGKRRGRRKTKFDDPNRPRKNDYKCYICKSESFGSGDALLAHLNNHTSELPYICTLCVKEKVIINSVTTLNVHKRMHENPLKCERCDRRYSNHRALSLHRQIHHSGGNDPCPSTCSYCGKVCPSKLALRNHEKFHTQGISCEFCGKVFVENNKLRAHIQRKHEKLKNYQCHLCQKRLTSLDAVQSHIKIMHSNREVRCKYCNRRYTSEYSLRTHEKKHLADESYEPTNKWTPYYSIVPGEEGLKEQVRRKKCNLCGAIVRVIGAHLIALHFPTEYRCELCNAVFKRKQIYELHMKEHENGKAHSCPICDKKFSERKLLITHLKTKQHREHPAALLYLSQTRTRQENPLTTELSLPILEEVDIRADALM